jgi:putative hydrolase of the HAD superfamily
MRFDAVAFDLDGTLYPAIRLYALALPRMLPLARELSAFNQVRRRMRELGADGAYHAATAASFTGPGPGPEARAAFRTLQAKLFAERSGLGEPKPEAEAEAGERIQRAFYDSVEELFGRIKPYKGLRQALDRIEASGLRLALLSDLPPERKLELMGLAGRFAPSLCSEDSGFLKPAAEPFAMLASALGLPPGRILYVGNNPRIDLAGAKAAGMGAAIVSLRRVKGADLSFWDWRRLADFATG